MHPHFGNHSFPLAIGIHAASVQSAPYEKSNSAYVHIIIYVLNVCVCTKCYILSILWEVSWKTI